MSSNIIIVLLFPTENSAQTMLTSKVSVLPRPSTGRIVTNIKYLEIQPRSCSASPTLSTRTTVTWISQRSIAVHRTQSTDGTA